MPFPKTATEFLTVHRFPNNNATLCTSFYLVPLDALERHTSLDKLNLSNPGRAAIGFKFCKVSKQDVNMKTREIALQDAKKAHV